MPRRPRTTRRRLATVVLAVAALGAAAAIASANGLLGGRRTIYTTAKVTTAKVIEGLTIDGSIKPVSTASVSFQESGTVASVDVQIGSTVAPGEVMASLDATQLSSAVTAAQATLTSDEDQLRNDEAALATQASTPPPTTTGPTSGGIPTISSTEGALAGDQQTAETDATTASAELAAATTTCTSAPTSATCSTDLAASLTAQQHLQSDQQQVASDEQALASLLASPSPPLSQPSTTSSGTSSKVTPAQIDTDMANIDGDKAALTLAQQQLAAATLRSPIEGTVEALTLVAGATSSSGSVEIVGSGGSWEITSSLTVQQERTISVGMSASIAVDGIAAPLKGTVMSIGPLTTGAGFTIAYPIVVTFTDSQSPLFDGASAVADVRIAQVSHVIAVPTSAVRTNSSEHSVEILVGGHIEIRTVTVGLVGQEMTQVKGGLRPGETVVLANQALPVPSSNNQSVPAPPSNGSSYYVVQRNGTQVLISHP